MIDSTSAWLAPLVGHWSATGPPTGLADRPEYPLGVERIGLVGLPNSGKSSLFNALTGGSASVASHPFSTTETSVGVAQVPDARLGALAAMSSSRKVVHAGVELVDIAGLVAGSSTGEGLGNRFLGGIREADALCLVLRAFEDPNVVGGSDPLDDLGVLELELVLADLATVESQLERRRKAARADRSLEAQVAALEAAHASLANGRPSTAPISTGSSWSTCAPSSCSPTSRCWPWSTWGRTRPVTTGCSPSR